MKFKRIVKFGLIGLFAIYFTMVLISAVKMKDVTKVIYSSSEYGVTISSTEIDLVNKLIIDVRYDTNGKVVKENSIPIPESKINRFKATCIFSYFPIWRKSYNNHSVMDGDFWEAKAIYKDGTEKETNGHEAYPFAYKLFIDSICKVK